MSDSDAEEAKDEDWEDWQDEECQALTRDVLYHEKEHDSPEACINFCLSEYGWDLRKMSRQWSFDIYDSIRAVNWIRRQVAKNRLGTSDVELIALLRAPFEAKDRPLFLGDDDFLQPYLSEDALLPALSCESWNDDSDPAACNYDAQTSDSAPLQQKTSQEVSALHAEIEMLRNKLELQEDLIQMAKVSLLDSQDPPSAQKGSCSDSGSDSTASRSSASGDGPAAMCNGVATSRRQRRRGKKGLGWGDRSYFDSYGRIGIHHEMLSDRVRTDAYRDFLLNNPSLVKDKVVLDVGCGTGILCMLAARGGARHVYGVDASDVLDVARLVVAANGLTDKITLIKGKVEEVDIPAGRGGVDLIVSEWMGYLLLYESMLDSVLWARDRWLAPGGRCMPEHCAMWIVAVDDAKRLAFWDDVYGFDMGPIKEQVRTRRNEEPALECFRADEVLTDAALLREFDCEVVQVQELEFRADYRVVAKRPGTCEALVSFFDVAFRRACDCPAAFSTGPTDTEELQTHWKQSAFFLKQPVAMEAGDAIEGSFHLTRAKRNPRHLDVVVEWAHVKAAGGRGRTTHQLFALA